MTNRMYQKCFTKFHAGDFFFFFFFLHAGDFLLDDAPWSGRPVEVDSDQIETLIENNKCSTT